MQLTPVIAIHIAVALTAMVVGPLAIWARQGHGGAGGSRHTGRVLWRIGSWRCTAQLPGAARMEPVPQAQLALLQSQLEPQVAGGEIRVSAHADGNTLVLQVADTGVGFDTTVSAEGFGVTQVRDRLATRYGSHRYYKFHSCSSRYYGLKPLKCI